MSDAQLERTAADFMRTRGNQLWLSLQSNPVKLSALITARAASVNI
jgi:hypothetical protein